MGSWRLDKAIKYLIEIDTIKITLFKEKIGRLQKFVIVGLTPIGMKTMKNKNNFKTTFGFKLNLKQKKWSWQISK